MALVLEEELEQLAHLGIVLDDQDRRRCDERFDDPVVHAAALAVRGCGRHPLGGSMTSMAKTEPLPGRERTLTRWPSKFPRRCTIDSPRPRPRLRSRAALSS